LIKHASYSPTPLTSAATLRVTTIRHQQCEITGIIVNSPTLLSYFPAFQGFPAKWSLSEQESSAGKSSHIRSYYHQSNNGSTDQYQCSAFLQCTIAH